MGIGVFQSQGLSQQLNLAPQLLQWLRLLQAPTTELSSLVQHELDTNPALELDETPVKPESDKVDDAGLNETGDDSSFDKNDLEARLEVLAALDADWRADLSKNKSANAGSMQDEQDRHQFVLDSAVADLSLQDHLLRQLPTCGLSEAERVLAELIVGSLDHRGYLVTSLTELAELSGVSLVAAERILEQVQDMEPAGIAARDLRECLLRQLEADRQGDSLAAMLVREHLDLLVAGNPEDVAVRLQLPVEEVRLALASIRTLNPAPGSTFARRPVQYVAPDAAIVKDAGRYVVELNDDSIPHLRLSAECRRLLEQKGLSSEDLTYIRRKIRNATFLIQGLSQRQDTLRRVIQEVIRVQNDFFDRPEGELYPLTMVKVAGVLGVHETTVSRAIANKYVQTPRGLFELKHFFRTGYQCSDGSAVTPDGVKDLILSLIGQESSANPLTDLQIVDLLQKKGLRLARRTVAKYRDELSIPASKDRLRPFSARKVIAMTPAATEEIREPAAAIG
ncbi:MAG: RNA polymerase sigma-54 factor [Lentisphaerae bacterium GWF2_57_35]|nr:MAG: RNA polymerase sigma-54 factor [Lentisphaerae bacterium GWF2_57_35]